VGVEVPELERLQVRVEPAAQVVLDAERHLAGDQPAHHRQPEPQDPRADDHENQRQQVRALPGLDRVDRVADEGRDRHGHAHRHRGEDQREDDGAAIGT
jgi:hypothetical protein